MGATVPELSAHLVQATWLVWGRSLGPVWGALMLLVALLVAAPLLWHFSRRLARRTRMALVGLRLAVLALLLFLLLNPVLVRSVMDKTTSVVAVLYDDSASMTVRGEAGLSRAELLHGALERENRAFERALDAAYHRVDFAFGAEVRPLASREHLRHDRRATDVPGAIAAAAAESRGLTLSAIVLFSDGAQSVDGGLTAAEALRDVTVPVYTVGVGGGPWRDLALNDVSLSRSFSDDAPATIGAQVDAEGFEGETLVLEVLDGGQVVAAEERVLGGQTLAQQFRMDVPLRERDWQTFDVRVRLKDGDAPPEAVTQNNGRPVLYDNREKARRVLYFAGRPNWQHKFMMRALAEDPEVQFSSLVRVSGAEKQFVFRGRDSSVGNPLFEGFKDARDLPRYDEAVFLRLGLGPEELAGGYPARAADLYPFHLVIWGDIEPDFFATPQLTLTRDAVSDRGASLLLLNRSEGQLAALADTVLAPLIPTMPRAARGGDVNVPGRVVPESEAFLTGVWSLHRDAESHEAAWAGLPELPHVQQPGPARIGATVVASSVESGGDGGDPAPFLVWQSYGLGKGALLATGETWPWHLQTESDNDAHGRLWRQLVRALLRDVPEPVAMTIPSGAPVAGVDTTLVWTVRDSEFAPLTGGTLQVSVTAPDGTAEAVPAQEDLATPGLYRASVMPAMEGLYRVRLEGSAEDGGTLPPADSAFLAEPDRREWRDPRFNERFLRDIAEGTGGAYFPLDRLHELPAALVEEDEEALRREEYPLWHAPHFYAALLILMAAEWALRRRAGQP